ncbi:hypothetical protein DFJ74DRAFT_667240 [Hyaloraphidium curvatum]|nr:hypothetical protein DFJ74DRAFT_667240 [Hyaloraphidium curvatum]
MDPDGVEDAVMHSGDQPETDAAAGGEAGYNAKLSAIRSLRAAHPRSKELRLAREDMAASFPLSEELWEEWIEDENYEGAAANQKRFVLDLCGRAVQDYLSPKLYALHIALAVEFSDPDADPILAEEEVRSLCQRANSACQWHIQESHLVWDAFRDFEVQLLDRLTAPEPREAQVNRIRTLYRDRLRVPHRTIEDTFSFYSSFETANDNQHYEANLVAMMPHYNRGKAELADRDQLEQSLLASGFGDEAILNYVVFEEQKTKDVLRIRTLYERAVAARCLDPSVWSSFIVYLMSKTQLVDVAAAVAERSTRNCPWSAELWAHRLRIMERKEASSDEIEALYLTALSNEPILTSPTELLKLLLAKLEYLNRSLKDLGSDAIQSFRAASDECQKMFDDLHPNGDPMETMPRWRISIERRRFGDYQVARKGWEALIKRHGVEAQFWLEFIDSERSHGDYEKCRTLFKQAVNRNLDWPEALFDAWLSFEREHGDIHATYAAMERIGVRRRQLAAKMEKTMAAFETANETEMGGMQEVESDNASKKRKKAASGSLPPKKKAKATEGPDDLGDGAVPAHKAEPDASNDTGHGAEMDIDSDAARTVYVSKLPVDVVEGQLRPLFLPFGEIRAIRIVRRDTTAFAYVEFSKQAAAQESCSLNGQPLEGGKPIKVAISNPKQTAPTIDLKELFVRNFPRSSTEDDLKSVFSAFGDVTGVRILRFEDGQSRGIAFVEFATEEAAAAALNLHNTDLGGRPLLVEHSDPKAKQRGKAGPASTRGRGGRGGASFADRRDGAMSMDQGSNATPRAARPGLGASRGRGRRLGIGAGPDARPSAPEPTQTDSGGAKAPARSNADFRSMFLKGKDL